MRKTLAVGLFISLLTGCVTLVDKPADIEWNACYQSLESPETRAFLERGIALLTATYGQPEIPLNEVRLRYSKKNESAKGYDIAERFSLTEVVDKERGIFCIYVGVPPGHEKFHYLLGHEIGHLLRPEIIGNAKEERFANAFSRLLCEQESRPFLAKWENRSWVKE